MKVTEFPPDLPGREQRKKVAMSAGTAIIITCNSAGNRVTRSAAAGVSMGDRVRIKEFKSRFLRSIDVSDDTRLVKRASPHANTRYPRHFLNIADNILFPRA